MGIEVEPGSGPGAEGEAGRGATGAAPAAARARRSPWAPVVGFWLAFGLLESAKMVLSFRMRGEAVTWGASLAYNLPWWLVWAALTPAVAGACRVLGPGPGRPSWPRAAAHLPIGAALSLLHLAIICAQTYVMAPGGRPKFGPVVYTWRMVDNYFMLDLLTYAGIVTAYVAWQWYRRYGREREASLRLKLRAAELERSLVEARLSALRMELNPHFLFNALNSVAGLVHRGDGERAVEVLAGLGDLLRSTLDGGRRAEVPLGEELALVEQYLAIEGVRFEDRLRVSLEVAPEARAASVPSMILQPLVENALRHGVGRSPGPGRVRIAARREGDRLSLSVGDSGPGFDAGAPPRGGGIGLSNTRSRLATRYGPRAELRVEKSPLGGAEVCIRLPYAAAGGGAAE